MKLNLRREFEGLVEDGPRFEIQVGEGEIALYFDELGGEVLKRVIDALVLGGVVDHFHVTDLATLSPGPIGIALVFRPRRDWAC